ncbi:LuxR C-terminal-related transcriptional regulator [Rhizobium sp. MHM7A]|uniref:response regulator transcription factor n=1 Tax=Rhizobium sp. MHM7A TaxID=2583233 RepID=UPI0011061E1B|nr:LuxR C-terminal-related transcriptional regulator [Rhizobium sp. MHM7A]TLX12126.1 response regulator transcription factor [Rhizobium sp. MHM7A]
MQDTTIHITPREKEVLQLQCEGKTAAEMSTILSLSAHTVRTYQARIKEKAGVYKDTALVAFAFRHGWVE